MSASDRDARSSFPPPLRWRPGDRGDAALPLTTVPPGLTPPGDDGQIHDRGEDNASRRFRRIDAQAAHAYSGETKPERRLELEDALIANEVSAAIRVEA
jgi:hypothetical protein